MANSLHHIQGVGLGLRSCHYQKILTDLPAVNWFEILTENYFSQPKAALAILEKIRIDYPITFHGVGLSLGSIAPLRDDYLVQLNNLIQRFDPAWISDHLSWSSIEPYYLNELFPLVFNEAMLNHVVQRIEQVQEVTQKNFLLENVSSYLCYAQNEMPEWFFLNEVAKKSGCKILLDINNIYVSAHNHGFSALDYVAGIDPEYVGEIHLAGHQLIKNTLIDTHDAMVVEPVWELYCLTLKRLGALPTLIEWDNNIPDFSVLFSQAQIAQSYLDLYS